MAVKLFPKQGHNYSQASFPISIFFECPFYAAFRQEMLQNVEIIIQDYSRVETSDLVKLFLYGTGIFEIDVNLFEKIQNYIFQTRRIVFKQ